MIERDFKILCKRLGYEFKHLKFLKQALTHCSFGSKNNERFEFLGDAILSFVITRVLFERFPEKCEGELTRVRASLVKGDMLADIALQLKLGDFLYLGAGELKSGGFRRHSILADALEAIIAAIYFDGGIEAAEKFILQLFSPKFEDFNKLQNNFKDAKTQLQEYLQAKKYPLPQYELVKIEGSEHNKIFHISCKVDGFEKATVGVAESRRKAEQIAAQEWLSFFINYFGETQG